MSVFIDKNTKVMVQGITGSTALSIQNKCLIMVHKLLQVTPGKGGQVVEGVPVYNTVAEAKEETGANVFCSLCSGAIRSRFYFGSSRCRFRYGYLYH